MGKEQAVNDPHGVPTGSVPRSPWGPLMHEEPTKEQIKEKIEKYFPGSFYDVYGYRDEKAANPANNKQIGGDHYATQKIQPWDALEVWLTPDQMAGHFIASAVQYLARYNAAAPGKGGLEDVKKAHHYLSKLIELQS